MSLAYFITFSTYGTWLHGTDKGMGSVDDKHNKHGTPYLPRDIAREIEERGSLLQAPFVMGAPERDIVRDSILELAEENCWRVWAVHVRSNHVHVVIRADREPGRLMSDLKARASRNLTLAGLGTGDRRRWTRHGSTLHLFDAVKVEEKIDYTLNRQGNLMSVYDGTKEPRTQ